MPVYVDPLMNHGGSAAFRWTTSCHMFGDSLEELHAVAKKIGLKLAWFQNKRVPHYDLNKGRHTAAIKAGVIQLDRRQAVEFWVSKGWHSARLRDMEFEGESPLPSTQPSATVPNEQGTLFKES